MTPKQKAIELVNKFVDYVNCWDNNGANYTQAYNYAKQCALITVDYMNESCISVLAAMKLPIKNIESIKIEYLEEVKQEIENL